MSQKFSISCQVSRSSYVDHPPITLATLVILLGISNLIWKVLTQYYNINALGKWL